MRKRAVGRFRSEVGGIVGIKLASILFSTDQTMNMSETVDAKAHSPLALTHLEKIAWNADESF